jgi:hypothetical protein
MGSLDLRQSLNDAIDSNNWSQVRVLGEKAVAEGVASRVVLHNLGLAYLHENEPALAVSVLLAIPKHDRDENTNKALVDALTRSNVDISELDLGAHGFRALLVDFAENIAPAPFKLISAISLPLLVVSIVLAIRATKTTKSLFGTVFGRLVMSVMGLAGIAILLSLGLAWFSDAYRGHWCAVVSTGGKVRLQPDPGAELIRDLQTGSPLLAGSDPKKRWVHILHSSGALGWIESINLRCVDDAK